MNQLEIWCVVILHRVYTHYVRVGMTKEDAEQFRREYQQLTGRKNLMLEFYFG